MANSQDFLASISPSTNLQSLITALQNVVQAVNALNVSVMTALGNVANPNAS